MLEPTQQIENQNDGRITTLREIELGEKVKDLESLLLRKDQEISRLEEREARQQFIFESYMQDRKEEDSKKELERWKHLYNEYIDQLKSNQTLYKKEIEVLKEKKSELELKLRDISNSKLALERENVELMESKEIFESQISEINFLKESFEKEKVVWGTEKEESKKKIKELEASKKRVEESFNDFIQIQANNKIIVEECWKQKCTNLEADFKDTKINFEIVENQAKEVKELNKSLGKQV